MKDKKILDSEDIKKITSVWQNYYNTLGEEDKLILEPAKKYIFKALNKKNDFNYQAGVDKYQLLTYLEWELIDFYINAGNWFYIVTLYKLFSGDLTPVYEYMNTEVWEQLYDYGKAELYRKGSQFKGFTSKEQQFIDKYFNKISYFSNRFFVEYFARNYNDITKGIHYANFEFPHYIYDHLEKIFY